MHGWLPQPDSKGPHPTGRPLLAISEIAGDLAALEAVLDAVRGIELAGIVVAGDHCLGGPHPFEVWQRLRSLGALLVRGPTDLALAVAPVESFTPGHADQERALEDFWATRRALGELVARRLGELPSSAVCSLDDRSGVMVMAGSPRDDFEVLAADAPSRVLEEAVSCVAEDVLVCGRAPQGSSRRLSSLLFVNAGSVHRNRRLGPAGGRTAHAVLLQAYTDGIVRAHSTDVPIQDGAQAALRQIVG